MLWISGIAIGALVVWAGSKTSRAGYESPDYEVVEKDGRFEVRDYPSMTTAFTSMKNNRNSGFGRLFRYISGDNADDQKIAMTTPVFMETSGGTEETAMMFVVPADVVKNGAPEPDSASVSLRTIKGGKYAALKFKGHRSETKQKEAIKNLKQMVAEKGLEGTGAPMFAYYDPPWTPEILRRNEVMIKLAP